MFAGGSQQAWLGAWQDADGEFAMISDPYLSNPQGASGAVFVWRLNSAAVRWELFQTLTSPASGSTFGGAVAIDGDQALVAASDGAHVYRLAADRSQWLQEAVLTPSNPSDLQWFGYSLDIDGDAAIVTAWHSYGPGTAYIFERGLQGRWEQAAVLHSPHPQTIEYAHAARIDAGIVAVSSVQGNCYSSVLPCTAMVNVYQKNSLTDMWEYIDGVTDDVSGSFFGASFDLNDGVLVTGAIAPEGDHIIAYVHRQAENPSQWRLEAVLPGSGSPISGIFLSDWLAVSADRIAFGDPDDVAKTHSPGSVHVYERRVDSGRWSLAADLLAATTDPAQPADLGIAVSLAGGHVVSGAGGWVQLDDGLVGPGSVYFFNLDGPDCNANGICDSLDIASGASFDRDADGVPDECQAACLADIAPPPAAGSPGGDGRVDLEDLALVLNAWGTNDPQANIVLPPLVDVDDLFAVINAWGRCP